MIETIKPHLWLNRNLIKRNSAYQDGYKYYIRDINGMRYEISEETYKELIGVGKHVD